MRLTIFAFFTITASIFISGCATKGMSEETKNSMKTFEADWKATGESMKTWGDKMNTTMADMDKMMKESMPMDASMDMSKMKPEEMKMHEEMDMQCKNIMAEMDAMKKTYASATEMMSTDEKAYSDWKKNPETEKMADADVMKSMADWNTKLAKYKDDMAAWDKSLLDMNEECKKVCMMPMEAY
ncbi:MAG: hypothetical protein H7Y00_08660 [Fimbriimonadaceae bacterium]|nr:hypothetical protein [Chitinophagales bacterium]